MKPLGRRFDAYQSFLLGCKTYWSTALYQQVKSECHTKNDTESLEDLETASRENVTYQYYSYLERHLQRMKYSGRYGIVPMHEPLRSELEQSLDQKLPENLLTLKQDFIPPDYFTRIDIHQHPGGTCGDTLAGFIYERGSRSMWPGGSKDRGLHPRFNAIVKSICTPQRVLDLGCGFGKSTKPFIEDFPDAEVIGIDVSAPCLKLAALTAHEEKLNNIQYYQSYAEETPFPSAKFDLVSSTMLLHEMPPRAIQNVFQESFRLLDQGGYAIHLDYSTDDDPFNQFIHLGHAQRNNEPFMKPLNEMDLGKAMKDAGFTDVTIEPFEEAPNALSPENKAWRFPWIIVRGQKK
ncbi:MAG: putative methyltransferase YcgJ [Alphaproteobacteria bacterium MarineAlpha4_Bin2]|nr:MAG: putative methyltransferase YcgJ [Alphaproteobacteria bacterium MarineAlpha4_Bin2]